VRSVGHKWLEQRDPLEEQVPNGLDDGLLLLPFGEALGKYVVDGQDVVYVPKNLADKILATGGGNDVL
jgi:hypothetical protein